MSVGAQRNPPGWPRAIAIAVFIFGAPALYRHQNLVRRPFDQAPVKLLRELRPECVLLGDSMLGSRIDPGTLDKISDIRCAVLPYQASGTAVWFLVYKNVIASQPHPPRWTIVFFRDKQLTMPTQRTGDRYRNAIEMCMRDDEPQCTSILNRARHDSEPWRERLAAVYFVQRKRTDWQNAVKSNVLKAVASRSQRARIRQATERIFGSKNQRADQEVIDARNGEMRLDMPGHEFQANVDQSFLPPMLEIAREMGTRLIFFRVKLRRLSFSSTPVEKPNVQKYQRELRAYLTSHGASLMDDTYDPDVTSAYYSGDDHVRYEMMRPYTELFWKKMRPRLDSADPSNGAAPPK